MRPVRFLVRYIFAAAAAAVYIVLATAIILYRIIKTNLLSVIGFVMVVAPCAAMAIFILHPAFDFTAHMGRGIAAHIFTPVAALLGALIFLAGLVLHFRRISREESSAAEESPLLDAWLRFAEGYGSRTGFLAAAAICIVGVVVALVCGAAAWRMNDFMGTPVFCGTACHEIMAPEWAAYQDSPHASIACVECHIGDTLRGKIAAKEQGTRELIHMATGRVPRPVPTPVRALPPVEETCLDCHPSNRDYPDRMIVRRKYMDDRENTPVVYAVNLKVGSDRRGHGRGIHWHADPAVKIEYDSDGGTREVIRRVVCARADGSREEYFLDDPHYHGATAKEGEASGSASRKMDCYDCHNRSGHGFNSPEYEVIQAMNKGLIAADLPFIYARSLKALKYPYESIAEMESELPARIISYYERIHPEVYETRKADIEAAVEVLKSAYRRNVHHPMRVSWNTYPDHIGHKYRMDGCFRCHNQRMRTKDGRNIRQDCSLCHDMITQGETPEAAGGAVRDAAQWGGAR